MASAKETAEAIPTSSTASSSSNMSKDTTENNVEEWHTLQQQLSDGSMFCEILAGIIEDSDSLQAHSQRFINVFHEKHIEAVKKMNLERIEKLCEEGFSYLIEQQNLAGK